MANGFYKAIEFDLAEKIRDIVLLIADPTHTLDNTPVGSPTSISKLAMFEEQKTLYSSTISSAFGDALTLWPITVPAAFANVLFTNQLILVEDEAMIVDTVDKVGFTFTVKARGHGGTTAVAHPIDSRVKILAITEPEGVVTNSYVVGDRIKRTNVFQEITTDVNLTYRAIEQAIADRDIAPDLAKNVLRSEEQERQVRKHLQQINNVVREGVMAEDAVNGQHTVGGYEQLVLTRGGQSQATLGYANGSYDYSTWTELMHAMHKAGSNANIIHTNVATKSKIIGFHDQTLYKKDIQNVGNKVGEYYDGVVAAEWDGRILFFLIDESIEGSQFNLVNFENMEVVPRKTLEGNAKVLQMAEETENSAIIHTTLRSEISLHVGRGNEMAICKNV